MLLVWFDYFWPSLNQILDDKVVCYLVDDLFANPLVGIRDS